MPFEIEFQYQSYQPQVFQTYANTEKDARKFWKKKFSHHKLNWIREVDHEGTPIGPKKRS